MGYNDRRPLENTPTSQLIRRSHNNRLGAVYSALQGFWEARHHAVAAAAGNAGALRRDAYTVVLFESSVSTVIDHDFRSEPANLLNTVLRYGSTGGTNFTGAIQTAKSLVERHWSNERYVVLCAIEGCKLIRMSRTPVVIFLSDGECSIADETMQDLCRRSIALG